MTDHKVFHLCWCFLLSVVAICVTISTIYTKQFGPEYVTINGKKMQCVAIQVTQTETAASCDWASIKEAE